MSPRLRVVAAAVLFSTGGAAIKLCGFGSGQLAAGRALVAACAMLVLIPEARRGWAGAPHRGRGVRAPDFFISPTVDDGRERDFHQATHPPHSRAGAAALHEHVTPRSQVHGAAGQHGLVVGAGPASPRPRSRPCQHLAAACAACWARPVMGYRCGPAAGHTGRTLGDHGPGGGGHRQCDGLSRRAAVCLPARAGDARLGGRGLSVFLALACLPVAGGRRGSPRDFRGWWSRCCRRCGRGWCTARRRGRACSPGAP